MGCPAETALERLRDGWVPIVCPSTVVKGILTDQGEQLIEGDIYWWKVLPPRRTHFEAATPGEANSLKKFYMKERELVPA